MAMTSSSGVLLTLYTLAVLLGMVNAHGRLWWPPARTTAWRHGNMFPGAPRDYNDNQLYCGGRQVQWRQNNGQCGVCGDNFNAPVKQHELGPQSLVKNIIIVETYKTGQVIDVTVEITANHKGYFEFRLCVRDDHSTTKLTHDCLNQNLLRVVSTSKTRRPIGTRTGRYVTSLQLPSGVTCKECVLQWKYNTGNDWGICEDGIGRIGCSATPEQFYGCADISITNNGDSSGGNNGNGGMGSNGNGNGGMGSNGNGNGGRESNGNGNGGNGNGGMGSNGNGNGVMGSNGNGNGGRGSNGNGNGGNGNGGMGSNGNGNGGQGSNGNGNGGNGNGGVGSNGNGNGGRGSNGNGNGGNGNRDMGSNGNGNGGVGSNGNGNGGVQPTGNGNNGDEDGDTTTPLTTSTTTRITTTTGSNGNDDDQSGSIGCQPSAVFANVPGMKLWCVRNCGRSHCPSSHCSPGCQTPAPEPASSICGPTLAYRSTPGMTRWCSNNCPGNCPSTMCNDACRQP